MFELTLAHLAIPICGVMLLSFALSNFSHPDNPINAGLPDSFTEHFNLVFTSFSLSLIIVVFAISLFEKRTRRLLICWVLTASILVLNPLLAEFMLDYVTSPNAYWRLFYILPVPFIFGIAAVVLLGWINRITGDNIVSRTIALVTFLPAIGMAIWFSPNVMKQPGLEVGFFVPKVASRHVEYVSQLEQHGLEGRMLAPAPISHIVPMLTTKFQMEVIRGNVLLAWGFAYDDREATRLRHDAYQYISGFGDQVDAFRSLIEQGLTENVVIITTDIAAQSILLHFGCEESARFSRYTLFVRDPYVSG
jgi:hypothetical protein